VHVIGKGITRFHAVYWPAVLLSAGQPLPTKIVVHDYLTVGGQKLSSHSAPLSIRCTSLIGSARMRCAGGSCATCCARATPTSARS
jgi:methionyl-tRNA synthetase